MSRCANNLRKRIAACNEERARLKKRSEELRDDLYRTERRLRRLEHAYANEYTPAYNNLKSMNESLVTELTKRQLLEPMPVVVLEMK